MLRNADEGGGVKFSVKKRYEGVRFNIISIMRGWVGVKFPGEKRYVTLQVPGMACNVGDKKVIIFFILSLLINTCMT